MTTLILPTDAPALPGPPQGRWTYDDWQTLSDDGNRYEIIDGVLYMSTAPSYFHQWSVLQLIRFIAIPAMEQGLVFPGFAPIGVLMPGCDPVQPDFVLVLAAKASIIHDRCIFGVPDAIVEILSPGNRRYDEQVKLLAYAHAGLPEYAIVDPAARTLSHYRLDAPGRYSDPRVFDATQRFAFDCLPDFDLAVGDLFAGSPDTTL